MRIVIVYRDGTIERWDSPTASGMYGARARFGFVEVEDEDERQETHYGEPSNSTYYGLVVERSWVDSSPELDVQAARGHIWEKEAILVAFRAKDWDEYVDILAEKVVSIEVDGIKLVGEDFCS